MGARLTVANLNALGDLLTYGAMADTGEKGLCSLVHEQEVGCEGLGNCPARRNWEASMCVCECVREGRVKPMCFSLARCSWVGYINRNCPQSLIHNTQNSMLICATRIIRYLFFLGCSCYEDSDNSGILRRLTSSPDW